MSLQLDVKNFYSYYHTVTIPNKNHEWEVTTSLCTKSDFAHAAEESLILLVKDLAKATFYSIANFVTLGFSPYYRDHLDDNLYKAAVHGMCVSTSLQGMVNPEKVNETFLKTVPAKHTFPIEPGVLTETIDILETTKKIVHPVKPVFSLRHRQPIKHGPTINPKLCQEYFRLRKISDRSKYQKDHYGECTFTLSPTSSDSKSISIADKPLSKGFLQSRFSQITYFFHKSLNQFLTEKHSKEECINLYANLNEWNRKIRVYNKKVDNSKLLSKLEKINPFFSFKFEALDIEPLNAKIWQLDLAQRNQKLPTVQAPVPPPAQSWQEWYAANKNSYVAHAVNAKQVGNLMKCGKVMPSEEILFKTGKAEHEGGYWDSHRQVTTTILHPELVLKMARITLDTFNTNEIIFHSILNFEKFGTVYAKEFTRLSQYGANESYVTGLVPDQILYAINNLSDPSLDKKLNWHYQEAQNNSQRSPDSKKGFTQCLQKIRNSLMPLTSLKIQNSVYATYGRIAWQYGPVVILRGKPDKIMQEPQLGIIPNEVCLLSPLENGGEYFGLDLAQEDTRILGPKRILEKYKPIYGSRIQYIEDLTAQEKAELQVDLQANVNKQSNSYFK